MKRDFKLLNLVPFPDDSRETIKEGFRKWHYTSEESLYKILNAGRDSESLHLTDIRFMNDESEGKLIWYRMFELLKEKQEEYPYCSNMFSKLFLDGRDIDDCEVSDLNLDDIYEKSELPFCAVRRFVLSLSASKNDLYMWNFYSNAKSPYGVGIYFDVYNILQHFDTEEKGLMNGTVLRYGNVLYNKADQEKEIIKILNMFEIQNRLGKKYDKTMFVADVDRISPFFKHEGFSHENEFRIIFEIKESNLKGVNVGQDGTDVKNVIMDYEVRNGRITPYIKVSIPKDAVKAIEISPFNKSKTKDFNIKEFLEFYGYKDVAVESSNIPVI